MEREDGEGMEREADEREDDKVIKVVIRSLFFYFTTMV